MIIIAMNEKGQLKRPKGQKPEQGVTNDKYETIIRIYWMMMGWPV
jgi:hypothetical protein